MARPEWWQADTHTNRHIQPRRTDLVGSRNFKKVICIQSVSPKHSWGNKQRSLCCLTLRYDIGILFCILASHRISSFQIIVLITLPKLFYTTSVRFHYVLRQAVLPLYIITISNSHSKKLCSLKHSITFSNQYNLFFKQANIFILSLLRPVLVLYSIHWIEFKFSNLYLYSPVSLSYVASRLTASSCKNSRFEILTYQSQF